ncbi:MAG: 1,2-phenylacetyl-CoA epoxidase, subunit C, partial [uncultured Arthrobacter sp.]
ERGQRQRHPHHPGQRAAPRGHRRLGRRAVPGGRGVRAVAGGRLPHPRPAPRLVDLPCPRARRGCGAGQYRTGPHRPRPLVPHLCRPRLRPHRGRPRLLPPRAGVPLRAPVRAAQRRLRPHHRPAVRGLPLPVGAVLAPNALHRRHPRRHRRQGRQGGRLPPRPQPPVGAAPGPGDRGVPPPHDCRAEADVALRRGTVRGRAPDRCPRRRGRPAQQPPGALRCRGRRGARRGRPRGAGRARRHGRRPPRRAQRAPRLHPRRTPGPRPRAPRRLLV